MDKDRFEADVSSVDASGDSGTNQMPRTCSVCNHIRRDEIDNALLAGEALRDIAGRVSIPKSALHRHKLHLSATLVKAKESEQVARADGLLDQLIELTNEARRLKQKAEAKRDYRTALTAVRELVRIVEMIARINGELKDSQINVINMKLDEQSATRVAEIWLARHNHGQP
jgi:hypothetical protein